MAPIPSAQPSSHVANPENENPPTATAPDPTPASPPSKKRKRKEKPHILHTATFKKPTWTYLHIELVTPDSTVSTSTSTPHTEPAPTQSSHPPPTQNSHTTPSLDPVTISTLLTPALSSFLGLTGSAIPLDILKTAGRHVWLRVARQDARAVQAGLAGWIGQCEGALVPGVVEKGRVRVAWRVNGVSGVLGGLVAEGEGGGGDLFEG
ncbi:hypothetical protein K491DRAFT_588492 [Lophiostoma macrostomum CBS 122681]|uniref:Ribonucleases P/MRP subunit Pop8-like domain-containing protein n=1 Tax=Lophiostoma macrostomum CBS 122681 TaxID=1314788 RepID=A0A6A6TP83_9PLEO|nr:hypothetical protein K491DRAFT_588492 [Lophiostoma macrostomum CBS 122681]